MSNRDTDRRLDDDTQVKTRKRLKRPPLYRVVFHNDDYTTRDFVRYSPPHIALTIPTCSGTPTMKSIARSTEGMYAMFTVGGGDGASSTYTSHDAGMSWTRGATSGVAKPDKDDLNLIYNQGRFVDMQIVWQNFSLPYAILIQAARAPPADDSIATRPLRSGAPAADQPTSNCCKF